MMQNRVYLGGNAIGRLLIVDGEVNNRSPLARALRLEGYTVEEAGSAHETLTLLKLVPYDLMVLDINLPGMSGVEVMRHVRRLHPELIIIILTGHFSTENAQEVLGLKAADYLCKPVSLSEISQAVIKALRQRS